MSARILLIEDSEDIVLLMSTILADEGYSLVVATDGEAGLGAFRAETPDLVLLDLSLPKISGWDLVPELRAPGVVVPIIALTAHAMSDDRERALQLGCTDYLSKPFEIDALISIVRRYLPRPSESASP